MNSLTADTPTVLFVCVSNGGKSQMAEALLRHMIGDTAEIHSAGTHPKTSVNALSAQVVAEVGADMSAATPKAIDTDLLVRADRVIVLGTEAKLEPVPGMRAQIEIWETDEPSLRGIDGVDRMRLIRDDIAARLADVADELAGIPAHVAARYRKIQEDLAHRFHGVFTAEEVRDAIRSAHAALAPISRIPDFLPVLVERFAKDQLLAHAQATGREAKARPELLFVCVHNAGRSQIGAALARHLSGGRVNVRSAGSRPVGEINPVVLTVLQERGVPVPDAYPKPLTDDVLLAADVIITMGCGDECPYHPGRRYEDWPVEDPNGTDLATVRRITDDIQIRVTRLLSELLDR